MTQSILVTGCSTGLGMETALYLAERGFRVYASMRDLERRARLEAEAERRKVSLRVVRLDVTDQESIDAAVRLIVDECGGIDGVVNNAGHFVRGFFEDIAEDEIRHVFETNVFGTLAVTRAVLPYMRRSRRGTIVMITSVAARLAGPSGSVYSASRFAQEGFTECLYQEVAPLGVRVVMIEPGLTQSESWTSGRGTAGRSNDPNGPYYAWSRRAEQLFEQTMTSSGITPLDVAKAVHRALTARRPRLRYVVGRRAALLIALRRYIPGDRFERIYFREVMRRITRA